MPSTQPLNSTALSPALQSKISNDKPSNGIGGRTDGASTNGVQPNGNEAGSQLQDGVQDRKKQERAKALTANSSISVDQGLDDARSREINGTSSRINNTPNGTVQTRKRSRSGTRIIRSSPSEHGLKNRGFHDPDGTAFKDVELHQYVQRDLEHWAAVIHDGQERVTLGASKRYEKDLYLKARGIDPAQDYKYKDSSELHPEHPAFWPRLELPVRPLQKPAELYGHGYECGPSRNRLENAPTSIIYPGTRPRIGKRRTKELHIRKKDLQKQAEQHEELVPVRLDIEWDKIRLRDTFTWNMHDRVVPPELFASQLVEDFGLPLEQCRGLMEQISTSIREQSQDFYPHVFIDEGPDDPHLPYIAYRDDELRIVIKLNITIGQHTLVDQFEWDINNSSDSPELFARQMATDLSLSGEFVTAIAHDIREQSQLFTRSLYILGHSFNGRLITDQDLQASMLPSPMPSAFRPYQAAKEFTPYLYELNEAELEKTELSMSREERRQKRSVNRRGGPALPDLKDRRRTIRTLVVSSVIPGAAEKVEDSRIFKRVATTSGKGKRAGYGGKDGLDDSDESESDDSAPDSPAIPAHLLAGTARTRGLRGVASVAQAALRGTLGRSATPEASTLHHHETRTSGRRFGGGKDYREESVDDSPATLVVKLRINPQRFRQFLRDQKAKNKPAPLDSTHTPRRALSEKPDPPATSTGSMGPPTTPGQHTAQHPHGISAPHKDVNPLHPHAAQMGRVDAVGPPSQENPAVS